VVSPILNFAPRFPQTPRLTVAANAMNLTIFAYTGAHDSP
jgi:hypothetical protein